MKKIFIFFSLMAILSSCEDMLVEVPKDFVSRANYYKNEADAEAALTGAYNILAPDYYGVTYYLFEELHSDYLDARGSQVSLTVVDKVLDQTNIGRAGTNWSSLYSGINRANAVIANVSKIENINADVKKRIVAEAYYLRASAYFNLVRGWGAIPLRLTESTDLSTIAAPREPVDKVYAQILEDGLKAEADLPESIGSETGRASKWAAKMLLAQVYLTQENWSKCAEKSNDIITSNKFSLVAVKKQADFYNIFASETSSEDIMSIHHSETTTSTLPFYLHRSNTYPYNYSSTGYYAWLPNTKSFIGSSWDNNDLRKGFNLYTKYLNANGDSVSLPSTTPILFKKFTTNTEGLGVFSVPIYRYAEALLMYAEASDMADGTPSSLALERLNMIKRRAYGFNPDLPSAVDYPSGMGKEAFRETVLKERGYEFLLERRRWWDLKRTGKVKEAFAAVGKTFIDARLLWPIPVDEINNNPAITQEDQNPGY